MKIAIYGDSFGCINLDYSNKNGVSAWPFLLEQDGKNQVDNYSKISASIYYTFRMFEQFKDNYDVNIILITRLGRLELPFNIPTKEKNFFTRAEEVEIFRKTQVPQRRDIEQERIREILNYADVYFKYGIGWENEDLARDAFIFKAKTHNKNNIFIPCFEKLIPETSPLSDVFAYENEQLPIKETFGADWTTHYQSNNGYIADKRKCHLSEENNKLIAEKILQAIENKSQTIDLKEHEFRKPTKDTHHYMEWITF